MTNSSYLQYLPPVLWSPENDPRQMLGRHLRIYEKPLTGLSADGLVTRASAPFLHAELAAVQMASESGASRFAIGDWITIDGTAERCRIKNLSNATMILDGNLTAPHPAAGTVRIADLAPGQTTFRANNTAALEAGYPLRILQAGQTEQLIVASTDGAFVTLTYALTKAYPMQDTAVPVKLIDGLTAASGRKADNLEAQIDGLFKIFNPWRTRSDFLDWLASWLALPLRPEPEWSDYQRRKMISQITTIYQQRGLKQGIYTYLDIYAVTAARPRMAVDDGEAILHPLLAEDRTMVLRAIAHSNTVSPPSNTAKTVSILLHPTGIAVDSKNNYFVCDVADVAQKVPRPPALWKVSATGEVDFTSGTLPMPMPAPIFSGPTWFLPCAVTVDASDRVAVLDSGQVAGANANPGAIYRFIPPSYTMTKVIDGTSTPAFPAIHPVDMVLDTAGRFVVLDRGLHPLGNPPAGTANPRIVVVSEGPLAVATHPLANVKEPTAILGTPSGAFLVADANDQKTANPADIWMVDPAANWNATSLLGAMPAGTNPLIFPTGMVWEAPNVLLVCDTGLRWGFAPNSDPGSRSMAEPAHIYRVDLKSTPPRIARVTTQKHLVEPTKMARDKKGKLLSPIAARRSTIATGARTSANSA